MFASTLAVPGLPERQAGMRVGGLYWLTCETQETADRLSRQVLAAQPVSVRAVLVNAAGSARDLVAAIDPAQGPGRLGLFDLKPQDPVPMILALLKDVPRVRGGNRALWVVRVSLKGWDEMVAESLATWCRRAQAWLARVQSTLLVVGDQPPPALFDMLLRYNDSVSGVGQIYITQGARHLLQHFWSNEAGVNGPHDYLMPLEGDNLRAMEVPQAEDVPPTADDQRLVLAQAAALGGEPRPTKFWQLFEEDDAFIERALQAQVATVVFALTSNGQVPALASELYRLRKHCGRSLKLLVREMLPTLRQNDEQLLLANGANLVVPAGTAFLRFLTLLRSIQGHQWRRDLADEPSAVLQRLRPLPVRGAVSPKAFAAAVKKMTDNTAGTEVRNQLLRLKPLPALQGEQLMQQLALRRNGDIACVAGGQLYLFLFACSEAALDAALRNVLRLPWQELLAGFDILTPYSVLPGKQFLSDRAPAERLPPAPAQDDEESAKAVFQALRPMPARLDSLEVRR